MAQIVDGKKIAAEMQAALKENFAEIKASGKKVPKLVSIMVGNEKGAELYVKMQARTADLVGIMFEKMTLPLGTTWDEFAKVIGTLNKDESVTAVMIQKPLPAEIDHDRAISVLDPKKDVEGMHPYNLGMILKRQADIVPCTPGAVMKILSAYDVDLYGKDVVIIGRSAIVGKPLNLLMLNESATTTVCHTGTFKKGDIKSYSRKADILVVAAGKPAMVDADWIKEGAVVVDVGINSVNGKTVGDVNFESVCKKASLVTPVPGGVGPVTASILMRNVLRAYKEQHGDA